MVLEGPDTPDDSICSGPSSALCRCICKTGISVHETQLQMASLSCSVRMLDKQERRTERKHDVEDLGLLVTIHSIADSRPVHLIVACSSQVYRLDFIPELLQDGMTCTLGGARALETPQDSACMPPCCSKGIHWLPPPSQLPLLGLTTVKWHAEPLAIDEHSLCS